MAWWFIPALFTGKTAGTAAAVGAVAGKTAVVAKVTAVSVGTGAAATKVIGGYVVVKGALFKGITSITLIGGVMTVEHAIDVTQHTLAEENISYPAEVQTQEIMRKDIAYSIENNTPLVIRTCSNGQEQVAIPSTFTRCPYGDYPVMKRSEDLLFQQSTEIK